MIRIISYFVVLWYFFAFTSTSFAAPQKCSEWLASREAKDNNFIVMGAWAIGYVTGARTAKAKSVKDIMGEPPSAEAIWGVMDMFCQQHPDIGIDAAAAYATGTFMDIRDLSIPPEK